MPVICEKVNGEVETEVAYICHSCNKTVSFEEDPIEAQEFLVWQNSCGFGSVFGDGKELELCLCQTCTKRLLGHYFIDRETGKFL